MLTYIHTRIHTHMHKYVKIHDPLSGLTCVLTQRLCQYGNGKLSLSLSRTLD